MLNNIFIYLQEVFIMEKMNIKSSSEVGKQLHNFNLFFFFVNFTLFYFYYEIFLDFISYLVVFYLHIKPCGVHWKRS